MTVRQELIDLIVFQSATEEAKLVDCVTWKSIGIDSLDTLEIMLSVKEKFNIEIEEDDEETLVNFNVLLSYLENRLGEQQ